MVKWSLDDYTVVLFSCSTQLVKLGSFNPIPYIIFSQPIPYRVLHKDPDALFLALYRPLIMMHPLSFIPDSKS